MLVQKPRLPLKDLIFYGFLPSPLKKAVYRLKGFRIGKKVAIGLGSVLCGKDVAVGDYSKLGFFTIIRGDRIKIGSHVNIGSLTFVDTPIIEIGDESKINEQVYVGGLQFPDSKFIMGRNCQIMQMSFLNPARGITIGDDTGIGGHCLMFGHNSWLSQFEGYDVTFEPIEIGTGVGLSWRVFLLPGSSIGDGSVIAPDSVVTRAIPPKSLAAGFPAKVINKPPDFPKHVTDEQKIELLKKIVDEMIGYFIGSGLLCVGREGHWEVTQVRKSLLRGKRKTWRLGIAYDAVLVDADAASFEELDVFVSLNMIPPELRKSLSAAKVMWLDMEKKERPIFWNDLGDEVALFLRRYGVRFIRVEA
jgi:acetyltransferase-like isoleucine patch superfamily enzyme